MSESTQIDPRAKKRKNKPNINHSLIKYSAVPKTPETSFENVPSATPQDQQCLHKTQCTTTPLAVKKYMTFGTSNSSTQNTVDVTQKQHVPLQHQLETLTHNIKLELYTDKINSLQHLLADPCTIQMETIAENTDKYSTEITSNSSVPKTGNRGMRCTKRSRGKESKIQEQCTTLNLKNKEKVKSPKKTQEEKYGNSVLTHYPKRCKKEPSMSKERQEDSRSDQSDTENSYEFKENAPKCTGQLSAGGNLRNNLQTTQEETSQKRKRELDLPSSKHVSTDRGDTEPESKKLCT